MNHLANILFWYESAGPETHEAVALERFEKWGTVRDWVPDPRTKDLTPPCLILRGYKQAK